MKKKESKELKEKILTEIKRVLKDNKTELTNKIEKAVKKSIKRLVKDSGKKKPLVVQKSKSKK
jgi:L-lactate utilization protein LutC